MAPHASEGMPARPEAGEKPETCLGVPPVPGCYCGAHVDIRGAHARHELKRAVAEAERVLAESWVPHAAALALRRLVGAARKAQILRVLP